MDLPAKRRPLKSRPGHRPTLYLGHPQYIGVPIIFCRNFEPELSPKICLPFPIARPLPSPGTTACRCPVIFQKFHFCPALRKAEGMNEGRGLGRNGARLRDRIRGSRFKSGAVDLDPRMVPLQARPRWFKHGLQI